MLENMQPWSWDDVGEEKGQLSVGGRRYIE